MELAAHENVKIRSLFGSWEKRGFVKVAVTRAVRSREGPLGELPRTLPTYPSPKLTLTLTSHLEQNDGLGEG